MAKFGENFVKVATPFFSWQLAKFFHKNKIK
jgi:hypothetical protein